MSYYQQNRQVICGMGESLPLASELGPDGYVNRVQITDFDWSGLERRLRPEFEAYVSLHELRQARERNSGRS